MTKFIDIKPTKKELITYGLAASLLLNLTFGIRNSLDNNEYKEKIKHLTSEVESSENDKIFLLTELGKRTKKDRELQEKVDHLANENYMIQNKLNVTNEENEKLKKALEKGKEVNKRKLNMTATAYISKCRGCSGFTYTGFDVRNTIEYEGMRIIAANFNKLPLYSIVEIKTNTETFKAIVLDTGGAIRNSNTIDLLVSTYDEAIQFGRQQVTVTMIRKGES